MFKKIILSIFLISISFNVTADDVYVIKNIKISATNKVASIARDEAIESGEMKAFRGLVKLHYPEAINKIDSIDKEDIYSLVKGYEISDEKRSATRYIANLKVKFSRLHVDKLMNSMGVNFSPAPNREKVEEESDDSGDSETDVVVNDKQEYIENNSQVDNTPSMTTLIVPVFIRDGKEYWLDTKDNIWLDVWQNNSQEEDVNKKFILPIADLEDLILLNKDILDKNLIDLAPLFEKYGVNNIAIYILEDTPEEGNHLVSLKVDYINKYHYSWQHYNFITSSGDDLDQLLDQSYTQAQQFGFNNMLNNLNRVNKQRMKVDFPVDNISDWVYLHKVLSSISYISDISLDSVALNQYSFSFNSVISKDDLIKVLKKHGFLLEENEGKFILVKYSPYEKY